MEKWERTKKKRESKESNTSFWHSIRLTENCKHNIRKRIQFKNKKLKEENDEDEDKNGEHEEMWKKGKMKAGKNKVLSILTIFLFFLLTFSSISCNIIIISPSFSSSRYFLLFFLLRSLFRIEQVKLTLDEEKKSFDG